MPAPSARRRASALASGHCALAAALREGVPRPVARAVQKALARVPIDRHDTAALFVTSLSEVEAVATRPAAPEKSLAVLPFANLSSDPENEYFADGVTEGLVCSLERPQEAENLSAAEKVAIRYGELMATDHLAISDATFAELREHFSEAEIVELGMTCAFFVGFGRLAATWHMVEDLPAAFQAAEAIAFLEMRVGDDAFQKLEFEKVSLDRIRRAKRIG